MIVASVSQTQLAPVAIAESRCDELWQLPTDADRLGMTCIDAVADHVSALTREARGIVGGIPKVLVSASFGRMRDRAELVAAVSRASSTRPQVLDPPTEARLVFRGAVVDEIADEVVVVNPGPDHVILLGGRGGELLWATALPIGTEIWNEQFGVGDPVQPGLFDPMIDAAVADLAFLAASHPMGAAVAVGEVATTVAALADTPQLNRAVAHTAMARLAEGPAAEVAAAAQLEPLLVREAAAGAAILEATRLAWNLQFVWVCRRGAAEGSLLEAA